MTIRHLYPAVEPSLNLDFANSKKLDSRITFTRGSTGTYTDESGIIRTAAANEARFDHDSDGNSLGLLIEESRTNEFPYSEDFSNSSWTKVNTTVTTNAATAPDGTSTANRLQIGATNGVIYDNAVQGVASNSTISMWVKAVNPGTDDVFRLASAGDLTADLTATNEWVRYTFTSSTNTSSLHGIARPSDNTAADVYVWGAQFEEGKTFPTSYIPTAGATATRAADVASMTGSNFSSWYNQSEGSTLINYNAPNAIIDTDYPRLFAFNSGFATDFSTFAFNGANNSMFVNYVTGSSAKLGVSTTLPKNSNGTAALAYQDNNSIAFLNENSSTQGRIAGPMSTILNRLDIGGDSAFSSRILNGHISRLTYYPVRLPDATLQALTL